jgi:pyrroloquinoline quinone biosynthesis protein D
MTGPTRITEQAVPALPRGVRLRHDQARGAWVLLAPERVFMPDDIAVEILRRCDGKATLAAIIEGLCADFAAPRDQIAGDVLALLQDLADKGMIEDRAPPPQDA